ncbi:hypothetical protein EDC19_0320 [Natranaerovirga hydrolytica]|uniref:Uncharacterized protein n=1 Tax=Natranaerovirga hydrolytica TaxID=680378 RepID=A0A4R1MXC7_9FIRM|nr:hypothetical protein [Natranaerovirga hydrolytica]TCK97918.1 hypothetical protein EDC19_0320 [Natranaerovirga hydrolytica]
MRLRMIQTIIMLIAGLITCVLVIINKYPLLDALQIIFLVLIIFYFLGFVTRVLLSKIMKNNLESEMNHTINQNEDTREAINGSQKIIKLDKEVPKEEDSNLDNYNDEIEEK